MACGLGPYVGEGRRTNVGRRDRLRVLVEEALVKDIMRIGGDIVSSERFAKARSVPHHSKDGNIAVHSMETAGYALLLARWLGEHGVEVSEVDAVRASLLHDIGMTVDEVFLSPSYIKARSHPREGARIAREEYGASEKQVDAVRRHMWPVWHVIPPMSAEGWVVSLADKCCSMHEVGRTTGETVEAAGKWILHRWHRFSKLLSRWGKQ